MSEMLCNPLLVFLGGGLGAVSRYLVTTFIGHQVGGNFPFGTFTANIIGSFLMGFAMFCFLNRGMAVPEHIRLLLLVGFLGGFTTFSSFSMETVSLIQNQHILSSIMNVAGNVCLGIGAVLAGMLAANTLN